MFKWVTKLPIISARINNELDKNIKQMEHEINSQMGGKAYFTALPKFGWSKDKILNEIDSLMDLGMYNKVPSVDNEVQIF